MLQLNQIEMRILCLHSNFLEFEPISKALKTAEEIEKVSKKINECLVCFTTVEKEDETDIEGCAKEAVVEIENILNQIKERKVVIYPFVHLSSAPSSPERALETLKKMEEIMKKKGYDTYRAPFGWYKKFTISCKGHPLAEWSREIKKINTKKVKENIAVQKEQELVSEWYIIDTQEKMHKIEIIENDVVGFDFSKHPNLEKFARYEMKKIRVAKDQPVHTKLMRELELADYEPASDSGNLRYYPKGRLIKSLIEEFVTEKVTEYGGMEVETPIMYDLNNPILSNYLSRFPARQYIVNSEEKELFLRFAACFGQFMIAKDMPLSYRTLPVRLYELSRYSFRREKSGEVVGLKRLRAFTMPDCHAICRDMEQVKEEFQKRFELCRNILNEIGIKNEDYEMAIRFTKEFFEKNKQFIMKFTKQLGKPVLVEMWDKQFFYFVLKYELNFIDSQNKAFALSTDQIDVENAKNYGIMFVGSDGQKHYPFILHCSPSGAIERIMCALLEKAGMEEKQGIKPKLPFWLAPIQLRIIPMSEQFLKDAEELAKKFNCRVDIDDRNLTLDKRIREAEQKWIPLILVFGKKEKESKELTIRFRNGEQKKMSVEALQIEIAKLQGNMPKKKLGLSCYVSKQPTFIG